MTKQLAIPLFEISPVTERNSLIEKIVDGVLCQSARKGEFSIILIIIIIVVSATNS